MQTTSHSTILGLDVGERRVGVAVGNTLARLPRPLTTLVRGESFWRRLKEITDAEQVSLIVVGLPRGLNGQETAQTKHTRIFAKEAKEQTGLPIRLQDEALTSLKAEDELDRTQKLQSVDALAATYILEDFMNEGKNYGAKK